MAVFVSYRFADQALVAELVAELDRQPEIQPFFYAKHGDKAVPWRDELSTALRGCQKLAMFVGDDIGKTQASEVRDFGALKGLQAQIVLVCLRESGHHNTQDELVRERYSVCLHDPAVVTATSPSVKVVTEALGVQWQPDDDLPRQHLFEYEKDVIKAYSLGRCSDIEKVRLGAPATWPVVTRLPAENANPAYAEMAAIIRPDDAEIYVDARRRESKPLFLREAAPRERLRFPTDPSRLGVGILVSGGIAPGINAVIRGLVSRHELYRDAFAAANTYRYELDVLGYLDGFKALLYPREGNHVILTAENVREAAHLGGSVLGTSRVETLLHPESDRRESIEQILSTLRGNGTDVLYVIGGDGSMRLAHALSTWAQRKDIKLSIVGIPKTMDNDILWVWRSFGYLSAVEAAKDIVLRLHTETTSLPRICVVQLFGSSSGFVVCDAVIATQACEAFLIPETDYTMKWLASHVWSRLSSRVARAQSALQRRSVPSGIILMSESAIPKDIGEYLDETYVGLTEDEKDAVRAWERQKSVPPYGQTPEPLRSAALKVVCRVLEEGIRAQGGDATVFSNQPRQLIRSTPPVVTDTVFAHRLASLAVDNAMAGYTDFMISQWLTEYVLVPLKLVVLGRKRVPKGFFWGEAMSMTAQPENMLDVHVSTL